MIKGQRRDARANRARIVEVARRRFDAGDDELPLNVIAAEAGLGVGTVYRNFPTRLALLAALAEPHLDHLRRRLEELAASERADALAEAFRVAADLFGAHGELLTVFAESSPEDTWAPAWIKPVLEPLESLLSRAVAAGAVRDDVTVEILCRLVCGVDYAARLSSDQDSARAIHTEIALRGISAARAGA